MTWLSLLGTILYYLTLPLTTIFWWTVACLAPFLHFGHYILSAFLLPLRVIAKFETLYIYLGVAALIGLVTGSILHFSSSILVSMFHMNPVPEETGRSAASVRAAREQKRMDDLEQTWRSSTIRSGEGDLHSDISVEKYAEWLNKGGDRGLLGQTILEEEDDSDEF